VIPEIDIWRAAQLMLKRYGDQALEESTARVDELAAAGDSNGAATWRRITPSCSLRTRPRPARSTDRRFST
jgi:hypothetical protein